jgi:hypothetical protein
MRVTKITDDMKRATTLPERQEPTREYFETMFPGQSEDAARKMWNKLQADPEVRARHDENQRHDKFRAAMADSELIQYWMTTESQYRVDINIIATTVADEIKCRPSEVLYEYEDNREVYLYEHGDEPAPLAFDHRDFFSMAQQVYTAASAYLAGARVLTAEGSKKFFAGDQPIEGHLVDALIQRVLAPCRITRTTRNGEEVVFIDSRLIHEVRSTMARIYPRVPTAMRTVGPAPMADTVLLAAPELAPEVVFFEEELDTGLGQESFAASDDIFTAYGERRARLGLPPLDDKRARPSFFVKFGAWAKSRAVHRGRPWRNDKQCYGYFGVALRNRGGK